MEDGTCITATTSFDGDPLLDALTDNGGPTLTHLPLPLSPAIDAVPILSCTLVIDQRGTARPFDGACDVGALELTQEYAPIARDDAYTTPAYIPLTEDAPGVLDNDADGDHDAFTAVLVASPVNGAVTLAADGGQTVELLFDSSALIATGWYSQRHVHRYPRPDPQRQRLAGRAVGDDPRPGCGRGRYRGDDRDHP